MSSPLSKSTNRETSQNHYCLNCGAISRLCHQPAMLPSSFVQHLNVHRSLESLRSAYFVPGPLETWHLSQRMIVAGLGIGRWRFDSTCFRNRESSKLKVPSHIFPLGYDKVADPNFLCYFIICTGKFWKVIRFVFDPAFQHPRHARRSPLHRAKINPKNEGTDPKQQHEWRYRS